MEKLLGVGTFAKVYEVRDLYNNKTFALKISKKYGAGHRTGVNEISVLEKLSKLDPNHEQLCVKMLHYVDNFCWASALLKGFPEKTKSMKAT